MAVPVNSTKCNAVHILPTEIQKFLDEALSGVVYVHFAQTDITSEIENILVKSFSKLKQPVLWEHNDSLTDLPSNVLIRNKLPFNSILSHQNVQLLVTDGETSMIKSSLFNGIPMLIIPFQNNQLHSAIKCTALENVSMIRPDDITAATLTHRLESMLNDRKYKQRAEEISKLLQQKSNFECTEWKESISKQKSNDSSAVHLHFDALGGLFFVIFVVVKVSLKFS